MKFLFLRDESHAFLIFENKKAWSYSNGKEESPSHAVLAIAFTFKYLIGNDKGKYVSSTSEMFTLTQRFHFDYCRIIRNVGKNLYAQGFIIPLFVGAKSPEGNGCRKLHIITRYASIKIMFTKSLL